MKPQIFHILCKSNRLSVQNSLGSITGSWNNSYKNFLWILETWSKENPDYFMISSKLRNYEVPAGIKFYYC